jgi:glycosyltransferase involved in cell wall biosynthesis
MKILILGSVALPVPPLMQGGTERIAWWQATGLAKAGHTVTLIAAKGSQKNPAYTLVEIGGGDTVVGTKEEKEKSSHEGAYTEGSRKLRKEAIYLSEVSQWVLDHGKEFDVILNNMRAGESLFVPVAKAIGVPYATVMHLPLFPELADYFRVTNTSVITISNAQRVGFDGLNYAGTVYNATDLTELPFTAKSEGYFLMMGSIAPHKNQKDGILAAKSLNKKIVLAGKIGNQAYWDEEIAPLIDGKMVVHEGELGLQEKASLLAGADALLFPIVWPEPFGLVMIEAMACGTPVVAYRNGAVAEVVVDGKTGFIVDEAQGVGGLVVAAQRIGEIDRADCRKYVEEHFTVEKMIDSLDTALQKAKNNRSI